MRVRWIFLFQNFFGSFFFSGPTRPGVGSVKWVLFIHIPLDYLPIEILG